MKNKRDFIREYQKVLFPYKEIISQHKGLKIVLFNEFLKTEHKPCLVLYWLEHYTERQLQDGIIEANKQIPSYNSHSSNIPIAANFVQHTPFETHLYKLQNEFYDKLYNKTLDANYYCYDLAATNTIKILNEIGKVIALFKKVLLTEAVVDYDTEAKNVSKNILSLIEWLEYQDLKKELFEEILNDKENIFIYNSGLIGGNNQSSLKDKYSRLKMYFDNYLKEGYRPQQDEVREPIINKNSSISTPEIKPSFKQDEITTIFDILKNFFSTNNQTNLKRILETGLDVDEPLVFNREGKTLLDFFKQLLEGQFVVIAIQASFEKWICKNFKSINKKGQPAEITKRYANRIISGSERAAKGNRLIEIGKESGKFIIVPQKLTNREQK